MSQSVTTIVHTRNVLCEPCEVPGNIVQEILSATAREVCTGDIVFENVKYGRKCHCGLVLFYEERIAHGKLSEVSGHLIGFMAGLG